MTYDRVRGETVLFGVANGVAQTWLFDGNDWRQGAAGPPARINPALVYDEARDRTVLTWPNVILGATLSTWEWDGLGWTLAQANGPVANHSVNGAYDSVRGYVMIVAAVRNSIDALRWDGTSWWRTTQFGLGPTLPGTAAAYHRPSRSIVAFGGQVGLFGLFTSDTQVYRRGGWRTPTLAPGPGPRGFAAMATEPSGHVLLLGGRDAAALGDSWRWDGTGWSQLSPPVSPSPRWGHAMTTDTARGRIVLFGGESAPNTVLADTWEWDGSNWLQRSPATVPPGRVAAAMAFDLARAVTLMFGGGSQFTGFRDDLWEWNGSDWAARALAARPSPRAAGQLTFDPAAGQAVLAGGFVYHPLGFNQVVADSWSFDGVAWSPITNGAPAFAVSGVGVFHEELRSTLYSALGSTHEYVFGSVAAVLGVGSGCAGSAGSPELHGLSVPRTANGQFAIWLSNALPARARACRVRYSADVGSGRQRLCRVATVANLRSRRHRCCR